MQKQKITGYVYVSPNGRNLLCPGLMLKFQHVLNNTIKTGIMVSSTSDVVIVKAVNSSKQWTVKFTDHHIYYKQRGSDILTMIDNLKIKH